ncbi:MAG: TIR domain-containing protein, partial [Planctomycetota bacterium]
MAESAVPYRYWAFISYSSKDGAVARKLHRRLETYRIPRGLAGRPGRDGPVPRRLFPVFRDREELPLSSDLGASIEHALEASRYLVVICSPDAASSRWVNEEVRFFKSLGREDRVLAIILRGRPNASDDPAGADEECFPPALRHRLDEQGRLTAERTEPVGGDLRPGGDGWTRALLKAVAGATGMGFDAFVRRDRRRRRRRRAVLAAVACLFLVAGLWLWDHNRLKTSHFANIASRWGVPTGVAEIDEDLRSGREVHYRIETRRGLVRRVFRENGAGRLIDDPDDHGAAIREIHYREDDTVERIDLRDHNERVVLRLAYSERRREADGLVQYVEFKQEHRDAPLGLPTSVFMGSEDRSEGRSDVTALRLLYDGQGRVVERRNLNAYRAPRSDEDGSFGLRVLYGEGLLPTRLENVGPDGRSRANRRGVLARERTYGPLGDVLTGQWVGPGGGLALGESGYAKSVSRHDAKGNRIDVAFFGRHGEPVLLSDGYHRIVSSVDDRGHVVEQTFFGTEGAPTHHVDGYHRLHVVWDDRGNQIEARYLGTAGEPVVRKDGYHRQASRYDARGNTVEIVYYGLADRPVSTAGGVHRAEYGYDDRGNHVETAFFGVDGKPLLLTEGWHRMVASHDASDRETSRSFFGTGGQPVLNAGGIHRVTRAFDELGNVSEAAFFGLEGEPVLYEDGYHRQTWEHDARGNPLELAFWGTQRQPVLETEGGLHRLTIAYDELGNAVELSGFGTDGQPVLGRVSHVHRHVETYDAQGNRIESRVFGTDGEPVLDSKWVHRTTKAYDERGNLVRQAYFGIDGDPITTRRGYHV